MTTSEGQAPTLHPLVVEHNGPEQYEEDDEHDCDCHIPDGVCRECYRCAGEGKR